jgi:hypothetical protein
MWERNGMNTQDTNAVLNALDRVVPKDPLSMSRLKLARELLTTALGAPDKPVAWYDEEWGCAYTATELDGGAVEGLVPLYTREKP